MPKEIQLANGWTVTVAKNHRMQGYYDLSAYASRDGGAIDRRHYGWGGTDRPTITEATDGLLARLVEVSMAQPPESRMDRP